MDHVKTQMPYSLSVCAISILIGYLPVAFGLSVWIALLLGFVTTALVVRFVGQKI